MTPDQKLGIKPSHDMPGFRACVAAHWMLDSLQKALLHWSTKLETSGALQ
jgi:hypothetical protein